MDANVAASLCASPSGTTIRTTRAPLVPSTSAKAVPKSGATVALVTSASALAFQARARVAQKSPCSRGRATGPATMSIA